MIVLLTFLACVTLFLGISLFATTQRQTTNEDYLLAGRQTPAVLTALSTLAANCSGFMFIGVVGYAYQMGLAATWYGLGCLVGEAIAWATVHRKLRAETELAQSNSLTEFLARHAPQKATNLSLNPISEPAQNQAAQPATETLQQSQSIAMGSALVTLAFVTVMIAVQLQVGSKVLTTLLGWPRWLGTSSSVLLMLVSGVFGGARASIWVSSVQALLMLVSAWLLWGSIQLHGLGLLDLWQHAQLIDIQLVAWLPFDSLTASALFVCGWLTYGFGVIGQPQTMSRIMAIDQPDSMRRSQFYYFLAYILLFVPIVLIGLAARVLLPDLLMGDVEVALPQLAIALLPDVGVGLVLVGLFSAAISTAEAQLLVCSAALIDLCFPQQQDTYNLLRLGTIVIAGLALVIALFAPNNVFELGVLVWAVLASSLGMILVIRICQWPLHPVVAIAMLSAGSVTVMTWQWVLHWSEHIYAGLPGMLVSLIVYCCLQPLTASIGVLISKQISS